MASKGSGEIGPKYNPGEIESKNDGKSPGQKEVKPLRHVQDITKPENNTSSSSRDTSKPEGTPTSEPEGTPTSEFNTEKWRRTQLESMTAHLRNTGQLGEKRNAYELGPNPSDRPTKKLRTEVTKELDTKPIVEVSDKENQPPHSLSPAEKAQNRRQVGNMLSTDQVRHVLGPTNGNIIRNNFPS